MNFGTGEVLLVLFIVFILFGSSKFPQMMSNLAEGLKVFKKSMRDKTVVKSGVSRKKNSVKKSVEKK